MKELLVERERVLRAFLGQESERIAHGCYAVARAFSRGGTLLAFGTGPAETDAAHVAVEFVHPVIVGKRALPALAPPNDVLAAARPGDIALGIEHQPDPAVGAFLTEARARGLLTLGLGSRDSELVADHVFLIPSDDRYIVQEAEETLYHVLWELVHVFFEHPGLLADSCITCGDVAVEARVVSLSGSHAVVEVERAHEEVAVDLVDVEVGDVVLCHAGVALQKLA